MISTEDLQQYAQALANAGHLGPEERDVVMERIAAAPYIPRQQQPAPTGPVARQRTMWTPIMAVLAGLIVLVGLGWAASAALDGDPPQKAAPTTTKAPPEVVKLDELAIESGLAAMSWDGDEETIDITITDNGPAGDPSALRSFLDTLGFRDAVLNRMSKTRALDGMQTETSSTAEITWTYHPDDGLQIVVSRLVEDA